MNGPRLCLLAKTQQLQNVDKNRARCSRKLQTQTERRLANQTSLAEIILLKTTGRTEQAAVRGQLLPVLAK